MYVKYIGYKIDKIRTTTKSKFIQDGYCHYGLYYPIILSP